jgi:3-oxoacyl-[acyl-carrier protein] reductase
VRTAYGRCDILINSAGFTKPVPHANLDGMTDELMDSVLIANVRGPFAAIRAFAPIMRETGDSVIINVSSIAGLNGSGSSIAYAASKAALDTMTMSLGRVLGPEIRVIAVSPGAVNTDFVAGRTHETLMKHAAGSPLQHIVQPADVARTIMGCILYMKSTTGAKIICDGGRFLG